MKAKFKVLIPSGVILCAALTAACVYFMNRDDQYTIISETFIVEPGKHDGFSTYPLIYDKNDIAITYPQITDLKDVNKQNEINALIEADAKKMLAEPF